MHFISGQSLCTCTFLAVDQGQLHHSTTRDKQWISSRQGGRLQGYVLRDTQEGVLCQNHTTEWQKAAQRKLPCILNVKQWWLHFTSAATDLHRPIQAFFLFCYFVLILDHGKSSDSLCYAYCIKFYPWTLSWSVPLSDEWLLRLISSVAQCLKRKRITSCCLLYICCLASHTGKEQRWDRVI